MKHPTIVVNAQKLLEWLEGAGFSKSQLAALLHVSRGRVSQLLTSKEEPSAHLIAKLLLTTRLPFEQLFQIVREDEHKRSSKEPKQVLPEKTEVPVEA
ncbi:MAG: helix-turn-helix domain-containing protein [Candidatus Omnitrophica bacterium]|nr:helix-turn-helix domain-containing protein [Candidatus Omnitrophota bacterium]